MRKISEIKVFKLTDNNIEKLFSKLEKYNASFKRFSILISIARLLIGTGLMAIGYFYVYPKINIKIEIYCIICFFYLLISLAYLILLKKGNNDEKNRAKIYEELKSENILD